MVRMPEDLANQIAAGEVVERPASAVKELAENALDASANRVRVDLEEGGLRLIRVTDDGRGMSRADATVCVERHATSKLLTREDLFDIRTLGFRGEALPSIASVSRFELTTKQHGVLGGTRVRITDGEAPEVGDIGCPPGTEVVVRDLFYNTPARLKFLKTRSTELKHVVEVIQRLALAHPGVAFTMTHNGRTVLEIPAVTDPADRVHSVLGKKEAAHIFPLEPAHQDGVTCTGFFGQPTLSRRTTAGIWAFVNGRYVRDKTVMGAVRVGYQGMVDKGRHPIVVLFLDVPPTAVDVNVHPMKTEVRFHASDAVFRAVRRALANSLASAPWVPQGPAGAQPADDEQWRGVAGSEDVQGELPTRSYTLHRSGRIPQADGGFPVGPTGLSGPVGDRPTGRVSAWNTAGDGTDTLPEGYFASLHHIGQFRGTYLLASDGEGLVVVDQHAAHERITFESLRRAWRERELAVQPLLVPRVLELDPARAATLADNLEVFERLGYEIEPFGGTDFALKSTPVLLANARHDALLGDALDEIGESGRSGRLDEAVDAVLLRMACHRSVRAGDALTFDEVHRLFRELDTVDFGANCPHGRPVFFRLSVADLEARFERR